MPKLSSSISDAVGDYLKALYALSARGPATTNAIAAELGLSAASVSNMLARLSKAGLIHYERYRGAHLTEAGKREALRLIRRHRLIETFMIERLGYGWDEVHEEAEAIEHAISDRFTEALAELLDDPSHDPHGDPIPRPDGDLPATPDTPLAEVAPGDRLRVARLLSQDSDVLAHLERLGLRPGRDVRVTDREPLGGLVHVEVDGAPEVLSRELAQLVRGEVRRR